MADNFVQSDVAADAANVPFTQQAFDEQPAQPAAGATPEPDETDAPEADPAQGTPAPKTASAPDLNAPRPVPGSLPLPPGAAPAPTMDYRLFYLNNAAKYTKSNGQTDENRLNAAFFQTVRQTGARVENVSDQEFGKRLKAAGADLPEAQVQQALKQANKGYGDYEKGRFNAFAGTLRNAGLNTAYNRRRGYITVQDNLDTRPADETAAVMGMSVRSHSDAGMTAADQIKQYYDQSKKALGDDAAPFRQTEVESQKARDFFMDGDHQVFVGSTQADGSPLVSDYTVAKPMLSPTDLVTSQVDPKTGLPRLVVWRNDSDANLISGQAMNIQALLPKPAELAVSQVVGDLIPLVGSLLSNEGTVWTGSNQTLNRLGRWAGDKVGYDPTRQDIESDGIGLGAGIAKGMAAVGAGNERLTAFEKGASKAAANLLGDYNFTIGGSGFVRKTAEQEKARLQGQQNESYRKAAQVQGNLNADQTDTMFSSLPAFFYNVSMQVGQQAIQQSLNVVAPGAGFAYMAATSGEQGYSESRKAGLSDGAATAVGGALAMLTYASESIFDIGISKYGRKLLTGGFEATLGAELGAVLKAEKTALLESVSAEARRAGLKNLTVAQATALAEKAAPTFLKNVQKKFNDIIAAAEKKAGGQILMATAKEGAQETLDQSLQTGAYTAGRQLGFEDGHGKLKDDLAPWVKKSLEDGSNPLAEKGWNQIMEDWYQAGIAGGLMGGVFGSMGARGMARQATLAQAAQASAAEHRDRQIATYLVEKKFTPGAADELRKELKTWHDKYQLGVRTRVDGQPANEQGSDSENTLVYQSLLNKVNVLQRLAQDTNLSARLTPSAQSALVEELVKYGNDNVRTSQGLDRLYKLHEQQQDLQRLLEGKAVRERNPLTGETAPLTEEEQATAPGFDPAKSFGLNPETYKLELDRRRAAIEAMADDSAEAGTAGSATGKSAQLKQLEEEAGRSQDAGALGVITRNRAVGAWYEASALVQELETKLATTDGSDYQQRTALRAQLQEARTQAEQLQKAMAQAVSQSSDGSLSRVQQIAEGQININALRTRSGDVFNGNLLRTHLQEGYLRYEHQRLSDELAPARVAGMELYELRAKEYERDFLEAAFTSQADGGVFALDDYNGRRKEFLAQRADEQKAALALATGNNAKVGQQLAALTEQATQTQAVPTPEGVSALVATSAAAAQLAGQFGLAPDAQAPLTAALDAVATHLENTARAATQDPALRVPALQAILDEENQQRRQQAVDAGTNPDEQFVRTPDWVQQDPDVAADYDQKVNARLEQSAPPEATTQLAQAAQLRETSAKLTATPAFVLPAVDDENSLESQWATHYSPAGTLVAAPGAVETVGPDTLDAAGNAVASTTGLPGRISKLQNALNPVEGESEASTAARLAAIDVREVADLIAQAHYHLAQLKANVRINNKLVAAGTLPAGTSTADLKAIDLATADDLIADYEEDYLPALDRIMAALRSQSGSRYAEDDEHRSVYLTERSRQLETYVAQSAVAGVDADLLAQAKALLQQIAALTATSRSIEVLTEGTSLLHQAEELLRQAFAAGTPEQQLARRQALYQEVLDGIEVKMTGDDPARVKPTPLQNDLQRYRQGLSYRGESEDGVFMALQQLFSINRAQWSQHYAAVGRGVSVGTDRFGLPAPIASLEQEQAVLGINAFFQGGDFLTLFPADSEMGRHMAGQAAAVAKGPAADGLHPILGLSVASGALVSRFVLYVTGFPGAGKTQMVAGSGLATLASLRGATKAQPLRIVAVAPHEDQRTNLAKALGRSSDALEAVPTTVSELLSQLKSQSLQTDVVVLDEGTILSGDEGNQLFEHLEAFNAARAQQGLPVLKVLVLGDPAQLAGRDPSGKRQAIHLFVQQRDVIKFQLPTLRQIYRSGFVVMHALQEELRRRILTPMGPGNESGRVNSDVSPVGQMAFSLDKPGQLNTLGGVQYQDQDSQRKQIAEHIRQIEAAIAADPTSPEAKRTLRVIVSENDVSKEVAALTALGIANAATYVTKSEPHGVLDVEKAQGQEFDFVYAAINETNAVLDGNRRPTGKREEARASSLRALNVAVSRAERYVSVRLSETDKHRQAELNNQQTGLQQFAPESAEARSGRTTQKLELLDAVAQAAPKTGPAPTAGTSGNAGESSAASAETTETTETTPGETTEGQAADTTEAPAAATPGNGAPLPASAQAAVQAVANVLEESNEPAPVEPGAAEDFDPETEDDRAPVVDGQPQGGVNPAQRLSGWVDELDERAEDHLATLNSVATELRRELQQVRAAGLADAVVIAQMQELLDEAYRRIDTLTEALQISKASAVVVPTELAAAIPPGATAPGQEGGIELTLDDEGLPLQVVVWKPEFIDGQFTKLRAVTMPASELQDAAGQPKSPLAQLRSTRAWLDGQIRDLENKRTMLEKSSVTRLAAENKVILLGHVMEAVADEKARNQRLKAKNSFTAKLYKVLFGQKPANSTERASNGTLAAIDFRNVLPATGTVPFRGNGTFYLVYHKEFTHGRVTNDTQNVADGNIFTIRYQEGKGKDAHFLDVGVIYNNRHQTLQPGELHAAGRSQFPASALDGMLKDAALRQTQQATSADYDLDARNELGPQLQVENFKTPGFDRDMVSPQPRTLSEKYAYYESQGLGASRPYIVTISGKDNVRFGQSDYLANNVNNPSGDTRASLSGGTVIFTSQGLSHAQVTALVDDVLAKAQSNGWSNQRTVDHLLHDHNLEMDAQEELPLSFTDYLNGVQQTAAFAFSDAAALSASLSTRSGLDAKGRRVPVFKQADGELRKTAWKENRGGWMVKRSLFNMAQARPARMGQNALAPAQAGGLPIAAYQAYGLLNKLFNVLVNSGIAELGGGTVPGKQVLTLAPAAAAALTPEQAQHLGLILDVFSKVDRHLSNDGDMKRSYETRYNQDLIRYLGYLDQHGAFKGRVNAVWSEDTAGTGNAKLRGDNKIAFRPAFMGTAATGPFTRAAEVPGLNIDELLASRHQGMSDPGFVVNLNAAATKDQPVQQSAGQLSQNTQNVAQQGQQTAAAGEGAIESAPVSPTPTLEPGDQVSDVEYNLNDRAVSLGDASPEEFIAQVRAAFGNSVPWALDLIGNFRAVLGAVVGEIITVNRAANGLVDRRTIKHEMVHYALRIVDPAYAALVYKDAREKLMPAENVPADVIAAMSDKQVNEWLSKHYERVYRDYEKRGEIFKRRTKYIPDSILRLYRALRGIYDHFNSNTDYTQRLFGDLEAGLFRGRGVQRVYRGTPRNADGAVDLSRVEFNRNAAGQRQHDFLELEKVFGSPQRRQQALALVVTAMQEQLNDYRPGKRFLDLAGALNLVRLSLASGVARTEQALSHPTDPFVLDNASANPAVAMATRNYFLMQEFQPEAGEENGEQQIRPVTTALDVIVSYLYPHLKVNSQYNAAQDPYAQDGDEDLSGSDGDQDSNGESAGAKANNINGRAYYLEDKNKAAKPGVELGLLLQTIPLYSKDLGTGQFQRDGGRRTVDARTVNSVLRRAVSESRRALLASDNAERDARQGRTDVTLEDIRRHLLKQFHGSEGRANFATGNRRDAVASVYLKLFGGVGALRADGTFLSDAVPVQRHYVTLANGQQVASTPFSMYQVAYPERAGAYGMATGLVDLSTPDAASFALHYQRLLSQLVGHYTSTQRREYLSVDFVDGVRETKDTSPDNALNKRKNYNQQALLNTFYTLKKGLWQPSSKPLTALKDAGFTFTTHEGGMVLAYQGNLAMRLGQYKEGGGQGFTATGSFDPTLPDVLRAEAAHKLLTLAGLPFDKKQLTEMLGTTVEDGVSSFEGFESFLGGLLARVWTSALGDSLQNGLHSGVLAELGASRPEVRAYLTGPLAMTSDYRLDFGNYDNVNAISGQGFDQSQVPQYRLSPTAHFKQVLGLAQFQNDWVRADVRDFAYSADGEKIYLEQLGNGVYPRLDRLRQQREAVQLLRQDNWQPGEPKQVNRVSVDGQGRRTDTLIPVPFDEDLIGWEPGQYSNGVADGSFGVKVLQVNALTDSRTQRKKSMVSATAKELHKLGIEHLFARTLIGSGGRLAQFFGAVISDKATQRVFELSQQRDAALLLLPGTPESETALRNAYRSYQAVLRQQVLPRYAAAGFVLSEKGQTSDEQALNEMEAWLIKQPSLPKNLVMNLDHNGRMGVNAELRQTLTLGEDGFVATAENDAREDARRIHADGYTFFPKALFDGLVKNKLLPPLTAEEEKKFAAKANSKGVVTNQLVKAADGSYHPLILAYANSSFVHGHALQTALDGHHLNYNGAVDRAKRGIISATNFESYDTHTPRGLGASSKMLVIADLDFAPVAAGQTFGMLDGYGRFEMGKLAKKQAQDGQGYMSVLHALLEDESYGGKYQRLATPAEMKTMGYPEGTPARRVSDFGTRKNIHGDGHGPNGAALLVKDSKTILTNNYLALGNEKIYGLAAKMLGGYESPLYQRWRVLHDSATPEEQAMNADWYQLYDEFLENRQQYAANPTHPDAWEQHHFGVAAHPSAIKVGQAQKVAFDEAVATGQVPHLVLDNRMGGKVLVLGQDPAGADISRITQEDHIISLLGDNFQTAQQVYKLLGDLAQSGLVNLDQLIAKNGGTQQFFMERLQDLLLNLGTVSNTLSLVRAGADPNVPLVLQPLHSAISSSIKSYSTKLRNKGLRATVQSSTGLVQMYNVTDAATGQDYRLSKLALVNQGYAVVGQRGELMPTGKASGFEASELDFMHVTHVASGVKLSFDEAKALMERRLRYEQMTPDEQQAFEAELEGYVMKPMEMFIARDFVKAFNIPAELDVADVNQLGEAGFLARLQEREAQAFAPLMAQIEGLRGAVSRRDDKALAQETGASKQDLQLGANLMNAAFGTMSAEDVLAGADEYGLDTAKLREKFAKYQATQTAEAQAALKAKAAEQWQNWQDILYVKGTRIPVTNLNSVQMGVVVGFHDGSQNVALVPSEMLLIAGADNDGDMITLEFLDLDKQGLRHRDQLDAQGAPVLHEKGIRQRILASKRDNVLLNPFNIDQLFKPIDFARFDSHVVESERRDGELRDSDELTGYALPTGGAARTAQNISQWIINQAGKSGVGPMVKAREAYNALHNYARGADGALGDYGQPSYWLGRAVLSPLDNPREVSYLFEDFANAALDNAKENYLGNLNFSKETWGVYSALIMTRQNLDEIMGLMTHPYAKKFVRGVQRSNTVDASGKQDNLVEQLAKRLKRGAPTFDEAGARNDEGKRQDKQGAATEKDKVSSGFGYAGQGLFDAVQARQQELFDRHAAGEADVYPNLAASVAANGGLTAAQLHATERYVLENLYLAAVRGDELLKAQGVLATMDGVDGTDYDNQRALDKVISVLPLYEDDKLAQLERLLVSTPAEQMTWAVKYQAGTKTINAGALFANNPFVQSSIKAILQDRKYKQSLFLARQPLLQRTLHALTNKLKKFNGYDERGAHKVVMRGLEDFIAQDFLKTHRPDISLEAQAASPLLASLAAVDVSTVAGRTRFGQLATAYVQELQVRERGNPQNPGVQDSPLVQELTITGGNTGRALSLNNATDLDPENKQVLESLFSELDTPAKYGVEGRALQQVLLYYNLSRNGLHLGKGSLAEVLSAGTLKAVSDHSAQLAARWKAAEGVSFLAGFEEQLISQNPGLSKEMRAFVGVNEQEAQRLADLDESEQELRQRGFDWYYADPSALPDTLSEDLVVQHAGISPRVNQETGERGRPTVDEFLHIKNQRSPGKNVLYRRSGSAEAPVWRRQYSALDPAVNNFGEYGYSALPVFERTEPVDFNADEFKDFLRKAQEQARALGQLRADESFDFKASGNQMVAVDKELRCK